MMHETALGDPYIHVIWAGLLKIGNDSSLLDSILCQGQD